MGPAPMNFHLAGLGAQAALMQQMANVQPAGTGVAGGGQLWQPPAMPRMGNVQVAPLAMASDLLQEQAVGQPLVPTMTLPPSLAANIAATPGAPLQPMQQTGGQGGVLMSGTLTAEEVQAELLDRPQKPPGASSGMDDE